MQHSRGRPVGQEPRRPRRQRVPAGGSSGAGTTPPPIPAGVAGTDLPVEVLRELRELPPEARAKVAAHLAAAGALVGDDDVAAYQHASYARRVAPRIAAVREATGITAYRTGAYAEALADLRAFARITGDPRHLPLIADCERGLGRPERALEVTRSAAARALPTAGRVELAIVASGARRDLGEVAAALVELRGPELDSSEVAPWTPRLWYAYADALLAAGRPAEAATWFASVVSVDAHEETDAAERVAALDG